MVEVDVCPTIGGSPISCKGLLGVVAVSELAKAFWASCAALLLLGAVVAYAQGRPASELHARAIQGMTAAPTPETTRPTSIEPSPRSGATSTPDPNPATGPGVDSPGVAITARVSTSSSLEVSESVRVDTPKTSITIAPPQVTGASSDVASLKPALTGVQLTAGGQVVPILETRIAAPLRIDLPAPADEFEVRYVLDGGVVRTLPSKAGRAIAGLAPVIAGADDAPVTYAFAGAEIIGVSCPDLGPTAFACAGGQPGRLSVAAQLQRSTSLVLLQLNLPRP